MANRTIVLDVDKFKEILFYSWHLLPPEKQQQPAEMGIYPKKVTPAN